MSAQNGCGLPFGMRLLKDGDAQGAERLALFQRPRIDLSLAKERISPIIAAVRTEGNEALARYTEQFDGAKVAPDQIVVNVADLPWPELRPEVAAALEAAYGNVLRFHEAMRKETLVVETVPGVECRRMALPIEAVGLYVPGGSAVLPSTAYMLATPAQVAGCREVVLATPPLADGSICPEVVYAAKRCGVTKLLKAGGAQAIAAMAYGTATCPKVMKIVGPGNQYVTAAKMMLQAEVDAAVSIDMPAGPSEQLCIFDLDCEPAFVVADLLSQAEHGPDSQVVGVLVLQSAQGVEEGVFLGRLRAEFDSQTEVLPRKDIAKEALSKSFVITVESREAALEFSNAYAPEHLCIQTADPESYLPGVTSAGSVFMGPYSPESCGDYASGTNHCLPTSGYARQYGGVSLDTFLKYITVQKLSPAGLQAIGPHIETLAEVEGLQAHKNAVTLRLAQLAREGPK